VVIDRLQQLLRKDAKMKGANLSKSVMGIIPILEKWGVEGMRQRILEADEESAKKEEQAQQPPAVEEDGEREIRDMTVLMKKFTPSPGPDDVIVRAYPVLSSFEAMKNWRYRVKLVSGVMKKGKASKQAVEVMCLGAKGRDVEAEFIRAVSDNEYISVCVGDVRVEGQGVNKVVNAQKTAANQLKSEKNKKKG